jgi:cobalt-zinc-cadmium efflux system outer membrane protein
MLVIRTLRMQMRLLLLLAFGLMINGTLVAQAPQDTLTINLQQAEKMFIDSNYILLAQHYNVDAQKALIEQAKVWQNPTLNTDFMIGSNGKLFNYGKDASGNYTGQYYVQLQQLILTAKKRGKQIALANTNAKLSELQLQDIMRNLRYQLHQDYYNIQQQLALLAIYNNQAVQLDKLVKGMQAQFNAGNIAKKDFVRVQALVVSLQQDIVELNKSISDNEADLKTLLQVTNANTFIKPSETLTASGVQLPESLEALTNTALQHNPYYLLQQSQVVYQQQNLTYQKALQTPDITLGPNFDRNSSVAPNYIGLGISIPIPVFNKNKGNIKSTEATIKQQQAITQSAETELRNNVANAYRKLILCIKQNNATQADFYTSYTDIYNKMLESYQQRQINLLEFLDFFNDYTDSQQKLMQQQLNLQLAKEELNYHTNH